MSKSLSNYQTRNIRPNSSLAAETLKAASCDEIRLEMFKTLDAEKELFG